MIINPNRILPTIVLTIFLILGTIVLIFNYQDMPKGNDYNNTEMVNTSFSSISDNGFKNLNIGKSKFAILSDRQDQKEKNVNPKNDISEIPINGDLNSSGYDDINYYENIEHEHEESEHRIFLTKHDSNIKYTAKNDYQNSPSRSKIFMGLLEKHFAQESNRANPNPKPKLIFNEKNNKLINCSSDETINISPTFLENTEIENSYSLDDKKLIAILRNKLTDADSKIKIMDEVLSGKYGDHWTKTNETIAFIKDLFGNDDED